MHIHRQYNEPLPTYGLRSVLQPTLASRAEGAPRRSSSTLYSSSDEADRVDEIGAHSEGQRRKRQQQASQDDAEFGRLFSARA
ncbi:MAG: hypothetical protein HIU93_15025 [Acidobacteria bacterium]|nr:hypothetical protein [Acidobacteriota bacterium]